MNPKDKKKADKVKYEQMKAAKEATKVIGDYQIDEQIGDGVSSKVFSAINKKTGEPVAIKKIKSFL